MIRFALAAWAAFLLAPPASAGDAFMEGVVNPTVQIGRDCSGTFVKSDRDEVSGKVETLILTAKHCVRNVGDKIEVFVPEYNADARRFKEVLLHARVKGKHARYDLALVELLDVDTLYQSVATIAAKDFVLPRFSEVVASGYPLALTLVTTNGTFSQRATIPEAPYKEEVLVSSVQIAGGSSGGGLYTKEGGQYVLVGVASMATPRFPYGLFVPFDAIADYLSVVLKPATPAGGPK